MQLFHGIEITYELSQTIDTRGEDLLDSVKMLPLRAKPASHK